MDILTHSVDFALHPLAWPMLANTEASEGAVPGGMSLPKGVTPVGAGIVAVVVIIAISVISIFLGALLAQKNTATGKIFKLAASEYKILIPATFSLYLNSALFMLLPYYGGRFVEMVGRPAGVSMDALNQVTAEILVVAVASSLTSMIRGALFVLAGERIVCELRKQVFRALLRQEIAFFDVQTTGALVSRLTNDTGTLQNAASSNISIFLRSSASLLLSVIVMLVTSWKLTLAMLVTVPVVSILAVFMSQISQRVSKKYQDETAEVGNLASETFGNLRTVRAFSSGEKLMDKKYCAASDLVYRYGRQRSMIYGAWSGVVGMLFFVAFTIVLRYGATLVHEGEMTSGQLISFVLYTDAGDEADLFETTTNKHIEKSGKTGAFLGCWVSMVLGPDSALSASPSMLEAYAANLEPISRCIDYVMWMLPHSSVYIMGFSFLHEVLSFTKFKIYCSEDGSAWHEVFSSNRQIPKGEVVVCKRLPHMVRLSTARNVRLHTSIIDYNVVITACGRGGQWRGARGFLRLLRLRGLRSSLVSFNAASSACERGSAWQWSLRLLADLAASHHRPDE
ncbi:abcB1, partial [Symbiodinium sp. CCMP2456]